MSDESDVEMEIENPPPPPPPVVVHKAWRPIHNMDVLMEALNAYQLTVSLCEFPGYDFERWKEFCNALKHNETLELIIFDRFNIPQEGLDVFFEAMVMNQTCRRLSLSEDLITYKAIEMLQKNKRLQTLKITKVHNWEGSIVPILAGGMAVNTSITRFEFFGHCLQHEMDMLMRTLCHHKKLHTLYAMPATPWTDMYWLCHLLTQTDRIQYVRLPDDLPRQEAEKVVRAFRQRVEEARVQTPLHELWTIQKSMERGSKYVPDVARNIMQFVGRRNPLEVDSQAVRDILNPGEMYSTDEPPKRQTRKRTRRGGSTASKRLRLRF